MRLLSWRLPRRLVALALWGICGAVLVPTSLEAHDFPDEVRVRAFVKPEGEILHFLARLPLEMLLNINLPKRGPGYIQLEQADEGMTRAASAVARDFVLHENGARLVPDGATMRIAVEGASAAQTEELRHALSGAMAAKAGRTLSQKNEERVKEIARLAKELLDSLSSSTDDDEKATPVPPEPSSPQIPAAKETPAGPSPASLRQRDIDRLDILEVEALSTLTG